jgi:hypothetical protein
MEFLVFSFASVLPAGREKMKQAKALYIQSIALVLSVFIRIRTTETCRLSRLNDIRKCVSAPRSGCFEEECASEGLGYADL